MPPAKSFMIKPQRKFVRVELDKRVIAKFPPFVEYALDSLAPEQEMVIKGGLARLCCIEALAFANDGFPDQERQAIERRINDVDIIIFHKGTLPKSKDFLVEKFLRIRQNLDAQGIELKSEDAEPVKGEIGEYALRKILCDADLTINESILAPSGGRWVLWTTKECLRDLREGVGFLNAKPAHFRYERGRFMPSNLGWMRLVKFLAEGKISSIYMPRWWREAHFASMKQKMEAGDLPWGASLGLYSLSLMEKKAGGKPELQSNIMKILNALRFTDIINPDEYIAKQKEGFAAKGQLFELKKFAFEEIIDRAVEKKSQVFDRRHDRNVIKNSCEHFWEQYVCDGCARHCALKLCTQCPAVETMDLPCNDIIARAAWPEDAKSLWRLPRK